MANIAYIVLTVSGIYLSGMTILSGIPNRLSIIRRFDDGEITFPLAISSSPSWSPSLFRAERITSGGELLLGDFIVCSRSKSSLDRAPSYTQGTYVGNRKNIYVEY